MSEERLYTEADLRRAREEGTRRMECGHLEADLVPVQRHQLVGDVMKTLDSPIKKFCRICVELQKVRRGMSTFAETSAPPPTEFVVQTEHLARGEQLAIWPAINATLIVLELSHLGRLGFCGDIEYDVSEQGYSRRVTRVFREPVTPNATELHHNHDRHTPWITLWAADHGNSALEVSMNQGLITRVRSITRQKGAPPLCQLVSQEQQ